MTPETGTVESGYRFQGGDPSDKKNWVSIEQPFPSGFSGSVRAQVEGDLRGLSDVLGAPVDLVNSGLDAIGLPTSNEPVLGSRSIRRAMNAPGQGLAWLTDKIGGEGTAARYGLDGHATYEDINEIPAAYRPQARVGEVFGETAGSILPIIGISKLAAPAERIVAASRTTGSAVKDVVNQQLAEAAKPGFAAKALPATVGAAAGAYAAETAMPGSSTAQFIAQLAGGLVPTAAMEGTGKLASAIKKPLDPFTTGTDEGAKTVIARALGNEFDKAKESPDAAIQNLRKKTAIPGATPAERSGSPLMMGVQNRLAENNPELANKLAQHNVQFEHNINSAINSAFEPGDRQALSRAAGNIKQQLDSFVSRAEQIAQEAAGGILPQTPREAVNVEARNILETALETARKSERELWSHVPKNAEVTPDSTIAAYDKIRNEMLPEASLPSLVERVIRRMKGDEGTTAAAAPATKTFIAAHHRAALLHDDKGLAEYARANGLTDENVKTLIDGNYSFGQMRTKVYQDYLKAKAAPGAGKAKPVSIRDIQNLRSEVLNEARIARSNGDFNTARRLAAIAQGALRDMETVTGDAAKLARSFSYELNERFSRTAAGDILGLKETGAKAVRPALTLETTLGKPQTMAEKLKELQLAATGIPKQIDEATGAIIRPAQLSPYMQQSQEQFLRSLSSRVTDVSTGRVNPTRAAGFLRDYKPVLDLFPLYRQKIENAMAAQLASERVSGTVEQPERYAFGKVLAAGDVPMRALSKSLTSPTPAKDFADLARMARQGGDESVGGLRATVLDYVMDKSLIRGNVSYAAAKATLTSPLYPNGPSLLNLMKTSGVISEKQSALLLNRLDAAARHEVAGREALRIDEVGDEAGKITRWTARIIGAKLASKLGFTHGGAGPSMQVAQIAASAAEQALTRLPLDRARKVLTDALAADSPEQLLDILERISATGAAKRDATGVNYMIPLLRTLYPQSQTKSRRQSAAELAR